MLPYNNLFMKFQNTKNKLSNLIIDEIDPPTSKIIPEMLSAKLLIHADRIRGNNSIHSTDQSDVQTGTLTDNSLFLAINNSKQTHTLDHLPVWIPAYRISTKEHIPKYSPHPVIALHQEIVDFLDYMKPTYEELFLRYYTQMDMEALCKSLWPNSELVLYGSMRTGLLLPMSDMDITLTNLPHVTTEMALTKLHKHIQSLDLSLDVYPQLILKTRVPLVKFTHKKSLISIDLSIDAIDGNANTTKVINLLKQYPIARPLIILIKYFLKQRDLDIPYKGGLGSFPVTLLVISFLQHHPIFRDKPKHKHVPSVRHYGLGKLLVQFFYYYGRCFNYNQLGVSLNDDGYYFSKPDETNETRGKRGRLPSEPLLSPALVLLEDPANSSNNATANFRQVQTIFSFFEHAWMLLTSVKETKSKHKEFSIHSNRNCLNRPTILSRLFHIDPDMIKARAMITVAYNKILPTLNKELIENIDSRIQKDIL